MQHRLFKHLQYLSLWALLPLLLALVPYQPIPQHSDIAAAITAHPVATLMAPLKTSFVKPTPPDTRRHFPPSLASANASLPLDLPGFRSLEAPDLAINVAQQISHRWQARAPPFLATSMT